MRTLLQLIDLITSDTITLAVSGVLVLAVLALLVLIAWPSRPASPGTARSPSRAQSRTPSSGHAHTPSRTPASTRSAEARVLFASGTPAAEVARRTGLSRDALALLGGMASASARQKAPASARLSVWQRFRRAMGVAPVTRQATV
jgi:hypothetical protein